MALAVVVVMPRDFDIRNRLYYFSGFSTVKANCWITKGVSVTVVTPGGLKAIDSVGRGPLMDR